jgi:uncharacterized protein involved in response to NO
MTARPSAPSGPAILAAGFRPFFLLVGLSAIVNLAVSLLAIQGLLVLAIDGSAFQWHFHEMMFGTIAAAITGFLLTAVPNWTGRLPLKGGPLLALVALWLAGRGVMATSLWVGTGLAALIDLGFLLALFLVVLREILAGRNWRNLPILLAVLVFGLANLLFHLQATGALETAGLHQRLAVSAVIGLMTLIGGRITPSFTRNWLVKRGGASLPAGFGAFDKVTILCSLAALLAWTLLPEGPVTAAAAGLAALMNALRLARWRGHLTVGEPLLFVLHAGYAWIVIGFALTSLAALWPDGWPVAAVHAFTVGAVGTMMLAVMSRATLGHTGRALTAGAGLSIGFILITLAAASRVAAALLPALYGPLVHLSAGAWIAAFVCFLIVCGPTLVGPIRRPGADNE